ncbi:putative transcription factor MYB-HB-like family [Lupinus albus]|uniref:Putative transcription factor MYB-HB-like family n=1 Tax=Lupinus albus TaxID=3870 RepID=A0A6A4NZ92_LUPAL|nr:putative transcription factor MYB-HB-like family [Lupinus albus]
MDSEISRWVLEFLLRSTVSDSLIAKTLTALPLSAADSRLKKTILLRTLQSFHSNASITETALQIFELIEEIDLNDAVPITDSMRRAFCAVAVECTVKYLAACPDDAAGNYFAAVRRIWRGRVAKMESAGRRGGLFSEELAQWRDELEAAVWDNRVCERLVGLNSRTEALNEMKVYLKEAWEVMGPSFLDSIAVMAKAKGLHFNFGGESVGNRNGGLEVSANVDGNDDDANNHDNDGDAINHDNDVANNHDNGGDASNHDNDGHDDGACHEDDKNPDKEDDLEERVGPSVDLKDDLAAERDTEIQKGNLQPKRKHLAHTCPDSIGEFAYGGELKRKRDEGLKGLTKQRRDFAGGDRSEPDDGGVCCTEDVSVSGEKQQQVEERVETSVDGNQELGGCDLPAQGEKEIQKDNLKHRFKHTALRRCHKGVKLSGSEEVEPAKSWRKCDSVPSAEVKKVRESLKSSSSELQALVKDPLPDALQTSEVVRSKYAVKDINQNGAVDVPDPIVCKSIVPFQPNDANLVKQPFVHCSNNVRRPNLLERKATARTYEWDDSLGNSPQVSQPRKRKRKWTSLEEETLRDGVKMFGEGSWAAIRSFYSNIFENRSGVDLKDKWRNMMR